MFTIMICEKIMSRNVLRDIETHIAWGEMVLTVRLKPGRKNIM